MKKALVSIEDRKAQNFGAPVLVRTLGEAERQFLDLLSDGSTLPGKHPEDFDLRLVGYFDDDSGILEPVAPVVVKSGSEVRK